MNELYRLKNKENADSRNKIKQLEDLQIQTENQIRLTDDTDKTDEINDLEELIKASGEIHKMKKLDKKKI